MNMTDKELERKREQNKMMKEANRQAVQSKKDEQDLLSIKNDAKEKYNPHPTYNAFKIRNIDKFTARKEIADKDGFEINENTKLLLFFGFVREYKGLKHLLRAMPEIKSKFSDCKVLVVGSFGDDKEDYLKIIEECNIRDVVCLKDTYTPDHEICIDSIEQRYEEEGSTECIRECPIFISFSFGEYMVI